MKNAQIKIILHMHKALFEPYAVPIFTIYL